MAGHWRVFEPLPGEREHALARTAGLPEAVARLGATSLAAFEVVRVSAYMQGVLDARMGPARIEGTYEEER